MWFCLSADTDEESRDIEKSVEKEMETGLATDQPTAVEEETTKLSEEMSSQHETLKNLISASMDEKLLLLQVNSNSLQAFP